MDSASEPNGHPEPENIPKEICAHDTKAEQIAERVRFVFRHVGDNLPARELEQRVMVYRLKAVSA